ncbi:RbsD or FucU transport [Petrotoga mobilis SJ95]|uniref:D-ribose pyranase n=1 Tax=Petrotoga mobilis (strain DSM 10674 / SJ95) TaxID=403833 RepID=RBSD_PETMO|nr:D-ribose pyranase [Petrotoga mobilis]A9BJQ0.1 RecName: Full=D-ribose pyranase [Petrotoga mobilis SJ95]ABX31643.1 RbsD or FucU transport [Petrotoga mobilis SJ95]
MKKQGIFNSQISYFVASMGHKDMLSIVDMGYPIPKDATFVDLVFDKGIPNFIDTIKMVLYELEVEKVIIAGEMEVNNLKNYQKVIDIFSNIEIEKKSHEEFKDIAKNSKFFIRTGECTPFSNIILVSGVIF